jgi:hypothetical protein
MSATLTQNTNQAVIPVTVTNNVTKGDYVYQYGTNIGWPKPTNGLAGSTFFLLSPNLQTSGLSEVSTRSITTSPMAEAFTYTGATVNQNTVTTPSTTLDASAIQVSKNIGLVGGNFVNLFMSATNTLSAKVFNGNGVQQGATLTLATNCTAATTGWAESNMFSGCGMADGGYVVVFRNTSSLVTIVRVGANATITFGPVNINAAIQPGTPFIPKVCATLSGGYLITFSWGSAYVATALYSANNVFLSGQTSSINLNSVLTPYGMPQAIQAFPIPLCLQNGAMIIIAAVGGYDSSYSYTFNLIVAMVLNAAATSTLAISSTNQGASGGGYIAPTLSVCGSVTDPSRFFACWCQDASYNWPIFTSGTATTSSVTFSNSTSVHGVMGNSNRQTGITPTADGNANVYVWNNSNSLNLVRYSPSASVVNSLIALVGSSTSYVYALDVFNTGWKTLLNYTPSSNVPTFLIHQSQTAAAGFTSLTTPYTPSQGYSLIGVAQNTANTGELCWVQTEGTAPLGAGFPSANVAFDYVGSPTNSTAKSAIKGNSGTTSGTSVILKGLK